MSQTRYGNGPAMFATARVVGWGPPHPIPWPKEQPKELSKNPVLVWTAAWDEEGAWITDDHEHFFQTEHQHFLWYDKPFKSVNGPAEYVRIGGYGPITYWFTEQEAKVAVESGLAEKAAEFIERARKLTDMIAAAQ